VRWVTINSYRQPLAFNLMMLCADANDLLSTHADIAGGGGGDAVSGDTGSWTSEQSAGATETRRRNKILVRRPKSTSSQSKMRTSKSMPKVSYTCCMLDNASLRL